MCFAKGKIAMTIRKKGRKRRSGSEGRNNNNTNGLYQQNAQMYSPLAYHFSSYSQELNFGQTHMGSN
jgi:hypothetical protein